jgi:sec-independent protein translocase protein TatC
MSTDHNSADPSVTEKTESFVSHLVELRTRIMWAFGVVLVFFLILAFGWPGMGAIYTAVAKPLMAELPKGATMISTDVTGTFMVPMKVTFMAAFVLCLPWVLYQIWAFVAPGLYNHEKKLIFPLIVSSTLLFFCGMAFAYYVFFPSVFQLFVKMTPTGVQMMTDIEKYLSFVMTMFIAFGIVFETPVVVVTIVRTGLVTVEKLKEIRPYVFLGAFIIGAIFTPPDVLSQFMLAVPLYILYEVGILAAGVIGGKKTAPAADSSGA